MATRSHFPDLELPQCNILEYLFPAGSSEDGEPIWINSENPAHSLSPKSLLQHVKSTAAGFQKLGIKSGDVVSVFTPNHVFVPVVYLATVASGAIFTGFNPAYTVSELVHLIKDSEMKVMFVHHTLVTVALEAAREVGFDKASVILFPDTESVGTQGDLIHWKNYFDYSEEAAAWKWHSYTPAQAATTVATINYSSGTTGLPKGVMVSHSSIIANLEQTMFIRYHLTPTARSQERWVGFLPLYHAYGQLYTILMACKLRIQVYIMESFHFEKFLSVIQKFGITNLQIAPPILIMLDKRAETKMYDLSSLREVVCGAAPIPLDLQVRVAKRFNLKFTIGWGMTELVCTGTSIPGGMIETTGSVGFQLPNTMVKLVDDDDMVVNTGERGEILYRGPNVCLGYWKNTAASEELLGTDGWLRTGDIAIRNEKGLYWIVDRKKELIKVNGLQVAPAELEGRLLENEHVADAAVVGITRQGNEYPRAYIVLKPSSQAIVTGAMLIESFNSTVAKHKHLRGGIAFVDQIPKLASGKIQRKVLREWAKRDTPSITAGSFLHGRL
ncbi:uncharacterized protein A1O9_06925 [Exophiala aquamarina CBS 119918]|uniref:4-coumarate-CoA ligase n=1 Tax=Exophiala aquamarina CBS 119918 TaxID=1182545 RepID=A0A072PMJ0_9EURO|nr:uncharacterized protein A1O9_06925 [Exophiala aquamarina CBS 119918]KEF56735.1 hypothetical protein A1O9_06925 [Exophiala aquamarina CBS 119918]